MEYCHQVTSLNLDRKLKRFCRLRSGSIPYCTYGTQTVLSIHPELHTFVVIICLEHFNHNLQCDEFSILIRACIGILYHV